MMIFDGNRLHLRQWLRMRTGSFITLFASFIQLHNYISVWRKHGRRVFIFPRLCLLSFIIGWKQKIGSTTHWNTFSFSETVRCETIKWLRRLSWMFAVRHTHTVQTETKWKSSFSEAIPTNILFPFSTPRLHSIPSIYRMHPLRALPYLNLIVLNFSFCFLFSSHSDFIPIFYLKWVCTMYVGSFSLSLSLSFAIAGCVVSSHSPTSSTQTEVRKSNVNIWLHCVHCNTHFWLRQTTTDNKNNNSNAKIFAIHVCRTRYVMRVQRVQLATHHLCDAHYCSW